MNRMLRAQAAMEYLMTYGWAILIIAVVLGSLAYLGVFSPSVGNTCTQQSGFLCSGMVYAHAGTLTVTVAQMSGTTWANWELGFQAGPVGTTIGSIFTTPIPNPTISGSLLPGVQVTNTITVGANTVGYPLQGVLWACWSATTNAIGASCGSGNAAMIGIINTKAQ